MPANDPVADLPSPTWLAHVVGCAFIVWFALMPARKRQKAARWMSMLMRGRPVLMARIVAIRGPDQSATVWNSWGEACSWWSTFGPEIVAAADELADGE